MIDTLTPSKLGKRKSNIDDDQDLPASPDNGPSSAVFHSTDINVPSQNVSPSRPLFLAKRAKLFPSDPALSQLLLISTDQSGNALHSPSLSTTANNNGGQSLLTPSSTVHNLSSLTQSPLLSVYSSAQHAKKLFEAMDKSQLVHFIMSLMDQSPEANGLVKQHLPQPTLISVSAILKNLETKLNDSFPYSKWGRDTSDYAFNRVRPVLDEIHETMTLYLSYFTNIQNVMLNQSDSSATHRIHEYPHLAFGYLDLATNLVHSLPDWSNPTHNENTKYSHYRQISETWNHVIRQCSQLQKPSDASLQGEVVNIGFGMVQEWAGFIKHHHEHVKGEYGFGQVMREFEQHFGWMAYGI